MSSCSFFFFFFNDTATTEIYTLSLHDALPICDLRGIPIPWRLIDCSFGVFGFIPLRFCQRSATELAEKHFSNGDRKSTRLNSSHSQISYAVFCLKKKKKSQFI